MSEVVQGATIFEGQMRLSPPAASTIEASYRYGTRIDLTGSELYFEVTSAGNQSLATWRCRVRLISPEFLDGLSLVISGGYLSLVDDLVGTLYGPITYNPLDHRWLRLRHSAGTIYLDAATNGSSWNNLWSSSTLAFRVSVTDCILVFSAGTTAVEAEPSTFVINNVGKIGPSAPIDGADRAGLTDSVSIVGGSSLEPTFRDRAGISDFITLSHTTSSAVAFVRNHTGVSIKTAGTTNIAVNISTATTAGDVLVAYILFDNAATASKPVVSSIAKMAGETANWVFLGAARSTSTSAGAFASGEMWAIQTTVAWSVATYTVTLDTTTVMKATLVQEFSGALATLRSTVGTAYSTTTTAASAATTGTTPVIGDLALGFIFGSNVAAAQAGDTDTTGGSWSAAAGFGSTGSGAATNNFGIAQYKILTAGTAQTVDNSAAMTAGNGAISAILQQYVTPAITQAAYRFYADGTETGSTALAAQDATPTVDVGSGDVNAHLRMRLQSTSTGAIPSTDDFQLQWEKNTSGTWSNVASAGTVNIYNSASLTDAAATTSRLTGGTGSFVAGKVSEGGLVNDLGWTANNYTEVLYSVTLKQADLANGDTLRFRVLKNSTTLHLTYSQMPTVAIVKTPVGIAQAAYRFYADGTESGSTALAAQDAGYVAVPSGDVNLLVRIRAQSTTTTSIPATDDFQLQCEANASGLWANVSTGTAIVDMYDYAATAGQAMSLVTYDTYIGQSFKGNGQNLSVASLYMYKNGTPTDNVVAQIYAATNAWGSNDNYPTGSVLASSTPVASSSVSASPTATWVDFTFDGTFTLVSEQVYFIMITRTVPNDTHYVSAYGLTAKGHAGNATHYYIGAWTKNTAIDLIFKITATPSTSPVTAYNSPSLTDAEATTNRLTGGTGTFQAGKVSETGLVTDLGWTGNNHTELLYAVTVKQSAIVDGDVLRFRVLRNGTTTGVTYTQVPQITIGTSGLPPINATDNTGLTDSLSKSMVFGINKQDVAGLLDSRSLESSINRQDAAGLLDSSSSAAAWARLAQESAGLVDTAQSSIIVVPAGGRPKVWDGDSHELKPGKVWTGSAWVEKPWKRWTGSAWELV